MLIIRFGWKVAIVRLILWLGIPPEISDSSGPSFGFDGVDSNGCQSVRANELPRTNTCDLDEFHRDTVRGISTLTVLPGPQAQDIIKFYRRFSDGCGKSASVS